MFELGRELKRFFSTEKTRTPSDGLTGAVRRPETIVRLVPGETGARLTAYAQALLTCCAAAGATLGS